jgi:hypothetical protein
MPPLSRKFDSLLPPVGDKATELKQIGEGLWSLSQEFGAPQIGLDIKLNMFVAKLRSGGLWVGGS